MCSTPNFVRAYRHTNTREKQNLPGDGAVFWLTMFVEELATDGRGIEASVLMCTCVVEHLQQYRKHSTAQLNCPCTKQETKYVPIRVPINSSKYLI